MSRKTEELVRSTAPAHLADHDLAPLPPLPGAATVRFEKRPARRPDGSEVAGLYNAWITLDNPA